MPILKPVVAGLIRPVAFPSKPAVTGHLNAHPEGALAGFESAFGGGLGEPGGATAGSAPSVFNRTFRRTVSRSIPSSRAISRCEIPCANNVSIESTTATLSRFAILGLREHNADREAYKAILGLLKMVGVGCPSSAGLPLCSNLWS